MVGRTARIGNEGLATSFYNDRDEAMADFLVKTLVECNQPIPDFLQDRMPEDAAAIDFNDDSGDEEEEAVAANGGGDAWGAGDGDAWGSGGDAPAAAVAAPVAQAGWGGDDGGAW